MLVPDTNHFTELERATSGGAALRTRLRMAVEEEIALTIITAIVVCGGCDRRMMQRCQRWNWGQRVRALS